MWTPGTTFPRSSGCGTGGGAGAARGRAWGRGGGWAAPGGGARLTGASVQESIDAGRVAEETGRWASRNRLQTTTLLDAIEEHRFDAVFGGGRRDEGGARGEER